MTQLDLALKQMTFARQYTLRLLNSVDEADWYRQPREGVSHIAWQVGHLAMADYRLGLERIRGRQPEDEDLISQAFLARFSRNSVPDPDPAHNPTPAELRAVLDHVRQQMFEEVKTLAEEEWDRPPLQPHSLVDTKLGCLFWCAQHEMVHAGQIGLLRRLLGHDPLW
jgi:uncharacterized damage-inducible protein DinB